MAEAVSFDVSAAFSASIPRNHSTRFVSNRDVEAGGERTEPGDGRTAGDSEAAYDEVTMIGATIHCSTSSTTTDDDLVHLPVPVVLGVRLSITRPIVTLGLSTQKCRLFFSKIADISIVGLQVLAAEYRIFDSRRNLMSDPYTRRLGRPLS